MKEGISRPQPLTNFIDQNIWLPRVFPKNPHEFIPETVAPNDYPDYHLENSGENIWLELHETDDHMTVEPCSDSIPHVMTVYPDEELRQLEAIEHRKGSGKRVVETAAAGVASVFAIPIIGLGALAQYIEDGHNPFFLHEREVAGGNKKKFLKIRSMIPGAEKMLSKEEVDDINRNRKEDPRVTRVGKWLRKFDIDEWPQLVQLFLEGIKFWKQRDFAAIGPRLISHGSKTCLEQNTKPSLFSAWDEGYDVMPGVIPPQIKNEENGHKDRDPALKYDMDYAEWASPQYDWYILWRKTGRKVFQKVDRAIASINRIKDVCYNSVYAIGKKANADHRGVSDESPDAGTIFGD